MRVTAALHAEPRLRPRRDVRGHDHRGPTEEREWRRQHSLVPDLHELGNPYLLLLSQQRHGIRTSRGRLPGSERRARQLLSSLAPGGDPLLGRVMGNDGKNRVGLFHSGADLQRDGAPASLAVGLVNVDPSAGPGQTAQGARSGAFRSSGLGAAQVA